jgi:hypothetical protein
LDDGLHKLGYNKIKNILRGESCHL